MWLTDYAHSLVDYSLAAVKLVQNREIGWATVNRKNGKPGREQQPIFKKLKLWFLFSRPVEWVDATKAMRLWIHDKTIKEGKEEASRSSASKIKPFIDFYKINMNDFEPSDPSKFDCFEDFFVRKHRPGARPVFAKDDPSKAVVVADCRLVVYPTVAETQKLWIKGHNFTIANLIKDEQLAQTWSDGAIASFRLSPQDYHRYHSPVKGRVSWFKQISGQYYQVDPLCLQSDVDILTENARCCVCIDTKEFGKVLFVAIGATEVGTVEINEKCQKEGSEVEKGEEIGLFQFGGSSIIVAFEKNGIKFDDDLLEVSRQQVMMEVEVGMSLGSATKRMSSMFSSAV